MGNLATPVVNTAEMPTFYASFWYIQYLAVWAKTSAFKSKISNTTLI